MSNALTLRLLFISLLLLQACKTIEVPEKAVLKTGKYQYEVFKERLERTKFSAAKRDSLSQMFNLLANSDSEMIAQDDKSSLLRKYFNHDSIKLEYFVFQPQRVEKVGLFYLGNGSNVLRFYDELKLLCQTTHTKIYVLNYRGYGKSFGEPSFKTQFDDNALFFDFLRKENTTIDFVMGYSLGSIFATRTAVENQTPHLFLLAPFSNATEMIKVQKHKFTWGPKIILRPFIKLHTEAHLLSLSNSDAIKDYQGQLYIAHGTLDPTLPYRMGKQVFENATTAQKQLHTIKRGFHNAPFLKDEWQKIIAQVQNI